MGAGGLVILLQAASGYPAGCTTDEQRQAFVDKIEREQGVHLEPSLIERNLGMRAITKLLMNS
jgi:hypothetical protein